MKLADRLRKARKDAGLTLSAVGKACGGITPQAVKQWEYGKAEPSARDLMIFAKIANVSQNWLLTGVAEPDRNASLTIPDVVGRVVPSINWADIRAFIAGNTSLSTSFARSHFPCGELSFQTLISDKSNEPELVPGDSIIIDPSVEPSPGDLCVAVLADKLVLRRYRPRTDHIELAPANPDWPVLKVSTTDAEIIGTVTEISKPRR